VWGVRANLPDLRLIYKRLTFENSFVVSGFDIVVFLVILNRNGPIWVSLKPRFLRVGHVNLLKVLNFSEDSSQVLDGNLACFVYDEKHEFSVPDCLTLFSVIVRVNCRNRWLFLDVLEVAPGQDELGLTDLWLGQPDIKNT
jgi:hypothetical protein